MPNSSPVRRRVGDGALARLLLIGGVLTVTVFALLAPLAVIFAEALRQGWGPYVAAFAAPDTRHAIWLSLLVALIVVPINVGFGIAAAWCIAKFRFRGRDLLLALVELPFSISPIIAGAAYLFVYGSQGLLGPALEAADLRIMFALPGIVLASMFVTAPFVARELVPLMLAQGIGEEEAAVTLGAGGWRILRRVTLPNVRPALLYGAVLCNARVLGEFGAVSVVSGSIRGQTNTLPLQIELLYQDNNAVAAFAVATLLTLVALLTLIAKTLIDRLHAQRG